MSTIQSMNVGETDAEVEKDKYSASPGDYRVFLQDGEVSVVVGGHLTDLLFTFNQVVRELKAAHKETYGEDF